MNRFDPDRPTAGLDPSRRDRGYWSRFQARVLEMAAPELTRRRMAAELTMSDVVLSWWRMLVPAAMATAILAGMVLFGRGPAADPVPAGIEELLVAGLREDPFAAAFLSEQALDAQTVLQAVEQR